MEEKVKALTSWEIGQDLIRAQDEIFECANDIEDKHPARKVLLECAYKIGDYFNEYHEGKSHGFGLKSNATEKEVKVYEFFHRGGE